MKRLHTLSVANFGDERKIGKWANLFVKKMSAAKYRSPSKPGATFRIIGFQDPDQHP
jgi:hypothetical protein